MHRIDGDLIAANMKIAFVVARFNEFISERLLEGGLDTVTRHGGEIDNITILKVPGAFELPLAAKKLADKNEYDCIVCLGAVIRGATSHYDYVCANASNGIASVSLESEIPISFGLLTTDTIEQAIERSGSKGGNKGRDAALSAIEMARVLKKL